MNKIISDIRKIMKENRITPKEVALTMGLKSHSLHWVFYTPEKVSKRKVAELIDAIYQIANNRRKEAKAIEKGIKGILSTEIEIGSWLKSGARNSDGDGISHVVRTSNTATK